MVRLYSYTMKKDSILGPDTIHQLGHIKLKKEEYFQTIKGKKTKLDLMGAVFLKGLQDHSKSDVTKNHYFAIIFEH